MKNKVILGLLLLISMIGSSGCEAIGAIFKGGVWTGVILVVGIIFLIVFLISRKGK